MGALLGALSMGAGEMRGRPIGVGGVEDRVIFPVRGVDLNQLGEERRGQSRPGDRV